MLKNDDQESPLICAFRLDAVGPRHSLALHEIPQLLESGGSVWMHVPIGHAGLIPWLTEQNLLPESVLDILLEREIRHRLEYHAQGFLLVSNDFVYDNTADPDEVAPVWIWVSSHLVLTARLQPLRTTDAMRVSARNGLLPQQTLDLFVDMLEKQVSHVERLSRGVGASLEQIEDQILKERISTGREQLGQIRRLATALRRHFRPLHLNLHKLLNRPPHGFTENRIRDVKSIFDDLAYLVEESSHQLEAAKLLQEELSTRDAEATGRNLYVLTIYTAAFLPMTLISGIFGMNLGGIPWGQDNHGFWWVFAMILISGLSVLFVSFRKFL